jgi:histidinol dehydrogenase
MLLSLVGFFYPGNEGGLYVACVLLYAVTASVAGYVSTTMYVQMGGTKWASNAVLTACIFAVPFFCVFAVLNTVAIAYSSQVCAFDSTDPTKSLLPCCSN